MWERGVGLGVGDLKAPTPNTDVPTIQVLQCGNVVLGVGLGAHAQHQCSHNAVFAVWERGVGGWGWPPTPNANALTMQFLLLCGSVVLGVGLGAQTPMFPQCSFCCAGAWCLGWGRAPAPNTNVPTLQFLQCGSAVLGRL